MWRDVTDIEGDIHTGNSVVWVHYNKAKIVKYLYIKRYVENSKVVGYVEWEKAHF